MSLNSHLAKEFGLSDVGLGKLCTRHDIPRPGVGYWAKKAVGKAPKRPKIPKCSDPARERVEFLIFEGEAREIEPELDDDIRELLAQALALPKIKVPVELENPHPLVKKKRQELCPRSRTRRDDSEPTIRISVSDELVPRALRYFDTLIKATEELGGRVESARERWSQKAETHVTLAGEKVATIRVRELLKQQKLPEKPKWGRDYELVSTGRLVLDDGGTSRMHSKDGKKQRIEDDINCLLVYWVRLAGHERIRRREREEEERRRREAERRREERRERQRLEQKLVDQLLEEASAWQQARGVREYVAAVRQRLLEQDGTIDPESNGARWLEWGGQQADRIDPLTESPPSVLDEEA